MDAASARRAPDVDRRFAARFAPRTAAVGATVAEAAAALGRRPSARDVAWYQDGPGRERAAGGGNAGADGSGILVRAQDLASAAHATVTRHRVAGGHGMARACFAADRFSPRTPPRTAPPDDAATDAASEALVHALDAATERLALVEEREGVARLAARGARWKSAALGAFAAGREAAARDSLQASLRAALAPAAPPPPAAVADAIARSRRACDVLDAWIEAAGRAGRQHDVCAARRQSVAAHRAHLAAAEWLLGIRPPAGARPHELPGALPRDGRGIARSDARACRPAGPAGAGPENVADVGAVWATTADLAPYARTAARLGDYPAPRAARLYVRARRAPRQASQGVSVAADAPGAPDPAGGAPGGGFGGALGVVGRPALPRALPPAAPARVDRVDALACLASAVAASRTPALVRQACALLGAVLRDAGAVRALLAGLPPGDAPTRHAAVVALGLLGVAPDWRDAVGRDAVGDGEGAARAAPLAGGGQDAIAFVVAVALAGPDGDAAAAAVLAARAQAGPAARPLLDTARGRLRTGLLLTAAE